MSGKPKKKRYCPCGEEIKNNNKYYCCSECYHEFKKNKDNDKHIYTQSDIINMNPNKLAKNFSFIFCHYMKLNKVEVWKFKGWANPL